ncbi:hypothetical protein [Patiriisocius sp. Uisw_017]|jgi:hypothetical protein|uniref:hypothetical protein n=1 Tax=Patiriisocius sp. Uisw_017 TaxID=3230968 RepID=UPI0039EBADFF
MKTLLLLTLMITTSSCSQDFGQLQIITSMPNDRVEISGIEKMHGNPYLWMIEDAGNNATVYTYNIQSKKMGPEYPITRAKNKDWEDITSDQNGNLYIGDFGNNEGKRKDLKIYKLSGIASAKSNDSITSIIEFKLEDQTKFPPKKKNLNVDIEGFFYHKNFLYLFTRNRSKNFDGTTKMYKLPATPGKHKAKLVGTYKTCKDHNDCQITAAAINEKSKTVALLSYNKVWIIRDYKKDNFLDGDITEIKLGHSSQKESVTFKDKNTLYIADERSGPDGGNLYELDIKKALKHK